MRRAAVLQRTYLEEGGGYDRLGLGLAEGHLGVLHHNLVGDEADPDHLARTEARVCEVDVSRGDGDVGHIDVIDQASIEDVLEVEDVILRVSLLLLLCHPIVGCPLVRKTRS